MDAQLYRLGDELAQAHLEIQKNDTEIGHLTKIVDEQANAIQTLEAATRRVVEAAVMAGELFQDIRNDYTDPRSECREGMRILKDSLADPILVALRREL
jgi:septation ring formation regulator EzrA